MTVVRGYLVDEPEGCRELFTMAANAVLVDHPDEVADTAQSWVEDNLVADATTTTQSGVTLTIRVHDGTTSQSELRVWPA